MTNAGGKQAAYRLFDTGAPGGDWAEFEALGFSRPVAGGIYRDGKANPGMPLGGIGTGFINVSADGTLDYMSTIFNDYLGRRRDAEQVHQSGKVSDLEAMGSQFLGREHIPTCCLPFVGFSIGDRTWVLTLQRIAGVESAREIHYWGHYPIADLEYEMDAPLGVGIRVWSPFLPGDAVASNTPGATMEIHLRSVTESAQTGVLAFSFHGPRQAEVGGRARFRRRLVDGVAKGVEVSTTRDGMEYSYVIAALGEQPVDVGGELAADGTAWRRMGRALPEEDAGGGGASVAVDFSVGPREAKIIRFVLSWYAPYWQAELAPDRSSRLAPRQVSESIDWSAIPGGKYVHMYGERFASARKVAECLAGNHESLLRRVLAWQGIIYSEERLPAWLRDSLVNVFHAIPKVTFWDKSSDPNHWCKEGFFAPNESLLSCPQQACIACDVTGDWPMNLFFPEVIRTKLRVFKHYQQDYGLVPSC